MMTQFFLGGGKVDILRSIRLLVGLVMITGVLFAVAAQPALGLWGDVYNEGLPGGSGWYGVGGDVYVYPIDLVPGGRHVSSLYVHHIDYNPYPNDGYNDGVTPNYIHMEVGVEQPYGSQPLVFWQWNKTPGGLVDWLKQYAYAIPGTDVWQPDFKIGNVSMGSYAPETWHLNDNHGTMESVSMPLVVGRAMASAERAYLDNQYPPLGDSNKSQFKGLERKNSSATWSSWVNATPIADGDPYYHFTKISESNLMHGRY